MHAVAKHCIQRGCIKMNVVSFYDRELDLPQEIKELFDEYIACNLCRDRCIERVFHARKAVYYSKRAVKAERKAWKLVYHLYPEVAESKAHGWFYDPVKQLLVKTREQKV